MKIRNLIVKMLFNKKQREVIHKSLVYSVYKYRKHGDVDNAVTVQTVLNEITPKLGVITKKTFTPEEVEQIVYHVSSYLREQNEKAYKDGVNEGERRILELSEKFEPNSKMAIRTVIDLDRCKNCDKQANCCIAKIMSEAESTDDKQDDTLNQGEIKVEENTDNISNTQE